MEEKYWTRRMRVTRRGFLRGAGALAGATVVGSALAACGGGGSKNSGANASGTGSAATVASTAVAKAAKANAVDAVDLTGKKVELTFWHTQTGPNQDKLNQIINAFNSSQPSVTVKPEFLDGYTNLFKKLLSGVSAGQYPELSVSYPSMVSEYQGANVVIPLDDYINSSKYGLTQAEQADYIKSYWDSNKYPEYGNKLLSFPFTVSMLLLYYNIDKLKAANITKPVDQWTWDDFVQAGKATTSGSAKGWAIGVTASDFDGMVYSRGGKLISDDQKKWLFNQQPGLDSLSLYQQAVKDGWGYQIAKQYADQADFGAGRATFALNSSSGLGYFKKEVDSNGKFNWSVAAIPHAPGVNPVTVLYGASVCIFKTTPEKQLGAWQFIKYFTSPDVTADWSTATGYQPVRSSAIQSEKVQAKIKSLPQYGVVATQVAPLGRPETTVKGTQDTRTYIEDAMTKVLSDPNANVKQVLDAAAQKADKALQA